MLSVACVSSVSSVTSVASVTSVVSVSPVLSFPPKTFVVKDIPSSDKEVVRGTGCMCGRVGVGQDNVPLCRGLGEASNVPLCRGLGEEK